MGDASLNYADVPVPESDDESAEDVKTATSTKKECGTFASYDSYTYRQVIACAVLIARV